MEVAIEIITPSKACQYLSKNSSLNRTIRGRKVDSMSSDMINGNWRLTHQGILFDNDGTLIDGQHRLSAIVKSGIPISMMVSRGADIGVFKVLDRGTSRSVADNLSINGQDSAVFSRAADILYTGTATIDNIDKVMRAINPYYSGIKQQKTKRVVTSAPFVVGAIGAIISGKTTTESADKKIRALTHDDLAYISSVPVLSWFYKKLNNGDFKGASKGLMTTIGFNVFSDENKSKLVLKNMDDKINQTIRLIKKELALLVEEK